MATSFHAWQSRIMSTPEAVAKIESLVAENPILIFMKGTPDFPQCGFSARTTEVLKSCGVSFAAINIYENEDIYRALPSVSDWPTFPQVFAKGEFIGGHDIVVEMYQAGELQPLLQSAVSAD